MIHGEPVNNFAQSELHQQGIVSNKRKAAPRSS
jgi:hypothetical protein